MRRRFDRPCCAAAAPRCAASGGMPVAPESVNARAFQSLSTDINRGFCVKLLAILWKLITWNGRMRQIHNRKGRRRCCGGGGTGSGCAGGGTGELLGLVEAAKLWPWRGAFLVWYDAASGALTTFDGRETAPARATPRSVSGCDGAPCSFFSISGFGGLSVGTPRHTCAGWAEVHNAVWLHRIWAIACGVCAVVPHPHSPPPAALQRPWDHPHHTPP